MMQAICDAGCGNPITRNVTYQRVVLRKRMVNGKTISVELTPKIDGKSVGELCEDCLRKVLSSGEE